ncbi:hypothetical protein CICLE_v10017944mg [Citrus x clementina]|uniref:Uncharacterized protein n=1 Tax=Citrus clementina TaxID=85681 RepID=V4U5M3_CITCL|nr:hypothetical protein CICLE_v10017944mg [Citrus x clementina]
MSTGNAINLSSRQQNFKQLSLSTLCKSIAISGLILFLFYSFLYSHPYTRSTNLFMPFIERKEPASSDNHTPNSPINLSHIVFVLLGSVNTWKYRKPYIEAWWRKNITRGHLWLDAAPTGELVPWPSSSPAFRVNEDITRLAVNPKSVVQIRMYHSIFEAFRVENNKDVKWYVMADDDTLVFVDNLVELLGKYDHTKYYYIGTNSESIHSNAYISFDMGYGGAGYALSYALVEALASEIDGCIQRYKHLFFSDYISQSCSADLGVDLKIEKGIHQIDLRVDISGLLSSHPSSPLISLHHFDAIDPIFPSKNRSESINHLMKPAKFDQSRYSAHIYQSIFPRSFLRRPLQTFRPWQKSRPPFFMFNTRWLSNNPCEAPHVFFLESVIESNNIGRYHVVVTDYTRSSPSNLPICLSNGNHSANPIHKIQVFSPSTGRKEAGRIECCDVKYVAGEDTVDVKLSACMKGEMLA